MPSGAGSKRSSIIGIEEYPQKKTAETAAELFKLFGIRAFVTAEDAPGLPGVSGAVPARGYRPRAGGRAKRGPLTAEDCATPSGLYTEKPTLWVPSKDRPRAHKILELARKLERKIKKGPIKLPPDENTLGFLDMLIHDCRQYLMIATGELKDIDEEGELELDDPTEDIEKITIRLKRLKGQCMRQAGRRGLDWQHGGGLGDVS